MFKRFSIKLKPHWLENLPIIGSLIYVARIGIKAQDIDKGILRKEIAKQHLIFIFGFLIYPATFLIFLTPWFTYWINNRAVKKTKKKLGTPQSI